MGRVKKDCNEEAHCGVCGENGVESYKRLVETIEYCREWPMDVSPNPE